MNHATIARARGHPKLGVFFNEVDILPVFGKGLGDRAADYATADDQYVCLVHMLIEYT